MRAELQAALTELAEMAKGATEREIETEVVHIFKQSGWPRLQINQDVPISDKGADKADIVLKLDNQPVILVEVKKYGHSRDADTQVNRYCRLLRPSPKLAFLTDGVQWVLYYVGQIGAIPIQEANGLDEAENVALMLSALNPSSLSSLVRAGTFQYLDIVEQGLQQRSEDTQKHLRPFFAATTKSLLMPNENPTEAQPKVATADPPTVIEEQVVSPRIAKKSTSQQGQSIPTEYNPFQPPPLSHAMIVAASFAGNSATNWNDLLRVAVKKALDLGKTPQEIRRAADINIQEVVNSDKGFALISGTNLSVQGQPSDKSWQNALRLAQFLGCEIEVKFHWSEKEKASNPGASGSLHWQP